MPYRDEIAAKMALTRVDDQHRHKKESRAYRCSLCGRWHLTSQARRRRK